MTAPDAAGPEAHGQLRRATLVAAASLLMGWLVAWTAPRDFATGHFIDDAHYAVLAKSIRESGRYRTVSLPDQPPETKYPPGMPAVLSLAWQPDRSGPANLQRLRYVNLLLLGPLAAAVAIFALRMGKLPGPAAVATALAAILHPGLAELWMVPLSEPLCLLLVTVGLGLAAADRSRAAVITLVLAGYVRTVALTFLVALLAARCRRPGARTDAALAAALVAPWLAWEAVHHDVVPKAILGMYGSYGAWYLDSFRADWSTVVLRVPWQNAMATAAVLGRSLAGNWLPPAVAGAVGAVIVWRLVVSRREVPLLALGLAVYGAAAVCWPFPAERFVVAVWPLVLVAVTASLARHRYVLPVLALAAAAPPFVAGEAARGHRARSEQGEAFVETLRPRVLPEQVVATTNPALHYLTLGVRAVPVQRMRTYRAFRLGYWSTAWGLGDDLWATIDRYRPGLLGIERRGVEGRYAAGSLASQCRGLLAPLWESGGAYVFAVAQNVSCTPRPSPR